MNLDGAPMLGTPKQNSFIIKLAGALGFTELRLAVNQGLGKHAESPYTSPFTMADASKVIESLLAACQKAGISTFQAKGGKGKKKKGRRAPAPDAEPLPLPAPVPGPAPREVAPGAVEAFNRMPLPEAMAVFKELAKSLYLRGEKPASCFSTGALADELVKRADEVTKLLTTEQLCGELERRGLPASFLITAPDLVAVAPRAIDALKDAYAEQDTRQWLKDEAEEILKEAGFELH